MNEFLEIIKLYLKDHPKLIKQDLSNFIYTQLISFNIGKGEPFKDVSYLFEYWIDRNKNKDNLDTFINEKRPYFCNFANSNSTDISKIAIKLYIPLDEEHLKEGANKLFDFIDKEKISHNSKIGKKIRNDNVVVRVSTLKEAEKVINFVKSEPYIQEGLLSINPFTINIDGVGIAKDGYYSYNLELCESIATLIKILYKEDRLDDLNLVSLRTYMETIKDFGDKDLKIIHSLQLALMNGKKLTLEDFKKIIEGKTQEVDKEEIFKEAILETYNKYGMDHTIYAIAKYRYNGDSKGFTRTNGARMKLISNLSIDDVNIILSEANVYGEDIIKAYIESLFPINEYDLIVKAYNETLVKYGKEQANYALEQYILKGETKFITNTNNARNDLKRINILNIANILRNNLNLDFRTPLDIVIERFLEEMNMKRR